MNQKISPPPIIDLNHWWHTLESQWKKAFNEAVLNKGNSLTAPTTTELETLWYSPALRFAGPTAPFPNMSFELTNLSGVQRLKHAFILVVIHHQLKHIDEVAKLTQLRSLFVYDNQIQNIKGIQNLHQLEEFYFHENEVSSITPLQNLTRLKTLYCHSNHIKSLEGITREQFYCLPNKGISSREVIKTEQDLYIRCLKA
jgi:Leucine-rich repeat (LRR) protein